MSTAVREHRQPVSYQAYWNLPASPFAEPSEGIRFRSSSFAEAEARLKYVIDSQAKLAILTGATGTGKTTLLRELSREYQSRNHCVVAVNILGMDAVELLEQLVIGLGGSIPAPMPATSAWREVFARLRVNNFQEIRTTFVFDNADQAGPDVHTAMLRIVHWGSATQPAATAVLSAQYVTQGTWAAPFLDQCPLHAELERWTDDDAADYIAACLRRSIFEADAVTALVRLSAGIPRHLVRLAEMALLAGAVDQLESIDATTVESVHRELGTQGKTLG
jgi:type II secretory pathway predicted ATPase ExeA